MPSKRQQRIKYIVSDIVSTVAAVFLFNIYRYYGLHLEIAEHLSLLQFITLPKLIAEDILFPIAILFIYYLSGFYNHPLGKSRLQELIQTLVSSLFAAFLIFFTIMINDHVDYKSQTYEMLIVLITLLFTLPYLGRYSITQKAINRFSSHLWNFNTLIIGNSRIARQKAFELSKTTSRLGFKISGHIRISGEHQIEDNQLIYDFSDIRRICKEKKIDQILIAPENNDENKCMELLAELYSLDIPIKIWPGSLSYITNSIRLNDIFGQPFVDLASPRLPESTKNLKRVFDIFVSAIALLLLSPLLVVIGIGVKLTSKGTVFYRQERMGFRRKKFKIIKFRTMCEEAEINGPQLSSATDPRITPFGRILRKYRLDELPQFWNVLKGDMSLVGPRPERAYFIDLICKEAPWYTLIHQVKPGITSWGMVKYGYATNVEQMVRRAHYDMIYICNMSMSLDFKILIYTIKTVLTGKGL